MASTSAHPSFGTRPYSSTHGKLPDRAQGQGQGGGGGGAFAQSAHPSSSRESKRLEHERQERERQSQNPSNNNNNQGGGGGGGGASNPLNNITDEQREEINEAFGLFDLDKDQRIDYHEFKVALKALGFDLPKPQIIDFLNTHGIDPSPPQPSNRQTQTTSGRLFLTQQAFQTIAASLIADRDPKDEILRAFDLFDADGKGIIRIEDLRRVARELGEGLEEDELVAMIEEFDLENKGGVGREEFVGICMG